MHLLVGVGDPAGQLFALKVIGQVGEGLGSFIAGLEFRAVVIDRPAVEPRRCPCFKAIESKAQPLQRATNARSCSLARSATRRLCLRCA